MENLISFVVSLFVLNLCLLLCAGIYLFVKKAPAALRKFPRPITDRILIEPIERDSTVRGMATPQGSEEAPSEGYVLAVGPGRITEQGKRIDPEVEVGDRVSFPSYAGQQLLNPAGFPEGIYLLVRQDELYLNHGPKEESHE
jgi:chaperonin GroES